MQDFQNTYRATSCTVVEGASGFKAASAQTDKNQGKAVLFRPLCNHTKLN
jgi:hypothetical protein